MFLNAYGGKAGRVSSFLEEVSSYDIYLINMYFLLAVGVRIRLALDLVTRPRRLSIYACAPHVRTLAHTSTVVPTQSPFPLISRILTQSPQPSYTYLELAQRRRKRRKCRE